MIITTGNELPGYEVMDVIGEVSGLTSARGTSDRRSGQRSNRWSEVRCVA